MREIVIGHLRADRLSGRMSLAGGVLRHRGWAGNLAIARACDDFTLHAGCRDPTDSSSGLDLRGRHEVQSCIWFGAGSRAR